MIKLRLNDELSEHQLNVVEQLLGGTASVDATQLLFESGTVYELILQDTTDPGRLQLVEYFLGDRIIHKRTSH